MVHLAWIPLLATAYLDAKYRAVAVWLLFIDVAVLIPYMQSLTCFIAGFLVVLMFLLRKPKIGAADQLLIPALVAAFGGWVGIGLFLGETYKLVTRKAEYPLLPWLILPCFASVIVDYVHLLF